MLLATTPTTVAVPAMGYAVSFAYVVYVASGHS